MNFEHFHSLLEIQSLHDKNQEYLKNILSHQQRINAIIKQRLTRETELKSNESLLDQLRKESTSLENLESSLTQRILKLKERLPSLINAQQIQAAEKELHTATSQQDEAQTQILDLIEKIEILDKNIREGKSFLQGSEKTLQSITEEANQDIANEERSIANNKKRIESLLESCPPVFKSKYSLLENQPRMNNVFIAFVNNEACSACHVVLNKTLIQSVHQGQVLENCPDCSRLLIPDGARNYRI